MIRYFFILLSLNCFGQKLVNVQDFIQDSESISHSEMIQAAIDTLSHGDTLFFPSGRYVLSCPVRVENVSGLSIQGQNAIIDYNSVYKSGAWDTASAFVFDSCHGARIAGFSFDGTCGFSSNIGAAIYLAGCKNAQIENCSIKFGGSLFWADSHQDNVGLRVTLCSSFGAASYVRLGFGSVISQCLFEQPDDVSFDAPNTTHAFYLSAGQGRAIFSGNTFKNIRTVGIKVSGSASPVRTVNVVDNQFIDCASAVLFGADDNQIHDNLLIENNQFIDCGTNRVGWNLSNVIDILGSRNVVISGNHFIYNRPNMLHTAGKRSIYVHQYRPDRQPVENVVIENNLFVNTFAATGHDIVTSVLRVDDATGVQVRNNTVRGVGQIGLWGNGIADLVFVGNITEQLIRSVYLVDCVGSVVDGNWCKSIAAQDVLLQVFTPPLTDTSFIGVNYGY